MISIVIPTFNEETTLEATIRQFEALTIPHEVIISDTASTDKTLAIAKRWANTVFELESGAKRGVANARNKGARAAKGEFIVFLDSSTMVPDPQTFFTKALAKFSNNPRLTGLAPRVEVEAASRTVSDSMVYGLVNFYYAIVNNIFGIGLAAGKFQMIRTDAFKKTGGFREDLFAAEDVEFFGRIAKLGHTMIALDLVVYHSGRRGHQIGPWHMLYRWIKNALSLWFFKKPADKEWEAIR